MKKYFSLLCAVILAAALTSCGGSKETVKIGVSLGVGNATRWVQEQKYMEASAGELGAEIEVRLNKTDKPKTQQQDCYEMIDSGIDVLILTPRDVEDASGIIEYAKKKKVKVINYARVVLDKPVDLFVGYDAARIGQSMGQYLSELVYSGDYIVLKGDNGDYNAELVYEGAMRYITPIRDNINVILESAVTGWSAEQAKAMVLEAVRANGNKVDAILAPNDAIAGACAEALKELGIASHVVITGMDAELGAARRIVEGTQDMTVYMDIKELAETAINAAYNMATNQDAGANSTFDNGVAGGIDACLATGKLVTKKNIDKVLIDSGYFTRAQVYSQP